MMVEVVGWLVGWITLGRQRTPTRKGSEHPPHLLHNCNSITVNHFCTVACPVPRDGYESEKNMLQTACVRPGALPRVGVNPDKGVNHYRYVDKPVV